MSLAKLTALKIPQTEVTKMISDLITAFSSLSGLKTIILIGSASRNAMTEASDIDLVLIFDTQINARTGYKEAQKRRENLTWPLDLICVDSALFKERSAIGGILFVAKSEGKIVFEKTP